jgi:hypothetical protein
MSDVLPTVALPIIHVFILWASVIFLCFQYLKYYDFDRFWSYLIRVNEVYTDQKCLINSKPTFLRFLF